MTSEHHSPLQGKARKLWEGRWKDCIPPHNWHHITQLLTFNRHETHIGKNWNKTGRWNVVVKQTEKGGRSRLKTGDESERDGGDNRISNSIEINITCFQVKTSWVQFYSQCAKTVLLKCGSVCDCTCKNMLIKLHKATLSFWETLYSILPLRSDMISHLCVHPKLNAGIGRSSKKVMNQNCPISGALYLNGSKLLKRQFLHRKMKASEDGRLVVWIFSKWDSVNREFPKSTIANSRFSFQSHKFFVKLNSHRPPEKYIAFLFASWTLRTWSATLRRKRHEHKDFYLFCCCVYMLFA